MATTDGRDQRVKDSEVVALEGWEIHILMLFLYFGALGVVPRLGTGWARVLYL